MYRYFLASMTEVIGSNKVRLLYQHCESAKAVYELSETQAKKVAGISKADIEALCRQRQKWELEKAYQRLLDAGIQLVSLEDEAYPAKLRRIFDPPYALFYKGTLPDSVGRSVSIVGARMCSEYGRAVANKLGEQLAAHGIQVISGMAKGVDSAAHYGALCGHGETYAVLGCGVDVCYPAGSRQLYDKLVHAGGLLSEYPPQTTPIPRRFPQRNRIISGLSDVVIVVEAKERSGSLITAEYALEQGREVYAVPGRITDTLSSGCNRLSKQGAGILVSVEDFLKDLDIYTEKVQVGTDFSKNLLEKEELLVYSVLDLQPKNLEDIAKETKLEMMQVLQVLVHLQNEGYIQEIFKNYYTRTTGSRM